MDFKSEQRVIEMFDDIAESFGTNLSGCTALVSIEISNGHINNKGTLICPDNTELKCEVKLDCITKEVIHICTDTCWSYLDNDEETDKDLQTKSKTLITVMTFLFGLPFHYTLKL